MIKKETQNTKLVNLTKEYNFILAILEVNLNKTTEYDLKKIASEFRNFFLPDLEINQVIVMLSLKKIEKML